MIALNKNSLGVRISFLAVAAGMLLLGAVVEPTSVYAQSSAYGCQKLATHPTLPSIEGRNGFFFRVFADLRMQHPMSDAVVLQMAELSNALAANGTTLIYVPIPTKSQTMPAQLPENVGIYGFDQTVADKVYQDQITRLHGAGVVAINLLNVLKSEDANNPPFFRSDFHWTSIGARTAAVAIGDTIKRHESYQELDPINFETRSLGEKRATSGMRRALQSYCRDSLPPVITTAYITEEVQDASAALDIFGSDTASADVALVGTSFSDAEVPNFGGFLSQFSALSVENLAVTGGNQFGAITSYLTSRSFIENRPRFLVWENPIYNNLAQFGDGPMIELIAAAGNNCIALPETIISMTSETSIEVDLSNYKMDADAVILADAGTEVSRKITTRFIRSDGGSLKHSIERNARMHGTGRYFISAQPFWSENIASLKIEFDHFSPENSAVSICTLNQG